MPTWRRLLYGLLCLALPLQSLAGSGLGLCGPAHGGMAARAPATVPALWSAAAAHLHAGHGDARATADASAGPGLGHAIHHAAPPADTAGDGAAAGDSATAAGQCGACAGCCAPAALPPAGIAPLPEAAPAPAFAARPAAGVLRFITDGPERPPRTPLA